MPVFKNLSKTAKTEEQKKEEEKKKQEEELIKKKREEMDAEIQKKVKFFILIFVRKRDPPFCFLKTCQFHSATLRL